MSEPGEPGERTAPELPFRVEVVRSKRRTKSYAGRLADGVLRVTVPSWMGAGDEQRAVDEMTARFRRKFSTARIDLRRRMLHLHRTYGLPAAREIRWQLGHMSAAQLKSLIDLLAIARTKP